MGALFVGADDGNRTRVFGLGSERSTIELHLHIHISGYIITQKGLVVKPFLRKIGFLFVVVERMGKI